ncbi:hypothetical protein AYM39_09685 [Methylomonas sp. DH-1]|nr:hypothetical protein AYM39_09685 [Methylomonas sp. DH-1]
MPESLGRGLVVCGDPAPGQSVRHCNSGVTWPASLAARYRYRGRLKPAKPICQAIQRHSRRRHGRFRLPCNTFVLRFIKL